MTQYYVYPEQDVPLPFFDVLIYRNNQPRQIRVFYVKVDCQMIPNKTFGRLTLFEIKQREWVSLDTIVFQLNV